jgi:WD40 repeat protein
MNLRRILLLLVFPVIAHAQSADISLYLEEGKSGSVWDVAVSSDGTALYSCGRDSTAKVWNTRTGECIRTFRTGRPTLVTALSLSGDQKTLAIGDMNGMLTIWEPGSGRTLKTIHAHGMYILDLEFAPDGKKLVSAGRDDTIRVWNTSTWELEKAIPASSVWVNDVAVSPDGRLCLSAGQDGTIKLWNISSGTLQSVLGKHRRFARAVRFANDGQFALSGGRDGIVKVWNLRSLSEQSQFALQDGFAHSITIDSKGATAYISMMNNVVEAWNWQKGLKVQRFNQESYGAMASAYSDKNNRLYTAHTSGAIKVWNCNDASLLVNMVGFSDGQWLTYTIDGYYDCSISGDRYVQWRKGQELYPLERYESEYKRPTIIEDALAGLHVAKSSLKDLVDPPVITMLSPRQNQLFLFGSEPLEVVVDLEATDVRGIEQIEVFVNGRPVDRSGADAQMSMLRTATGARMMIKVRVLPGVNTIEAAAFNSARVKSEPVRANVRVESEEKTAPNLFVLSVGIDQYAPNFPDLNYASYDAQKLAESFSAQEGKLYTRVYARTLSNREATRENILAAIGEFPAMKQEDMLVLFFSGHGVRVKDSKGRLKYYYASAGSTLKTMDKKGLAWDEFASRLSKVRAGRVILFLDACHSGAVSQGASNEKVASTIGREMGIVFASSSGSEFSYENADWKHGAFTYAILQAMAGAADFTKNNSIDWTEFQLYVISKVQELTGKNQNPMIPRMEQFSNFDFVRLK